jgi:hypothetical protein
MSRRERWNGTIDPATLKSYRNLFSILEEEEVNGSPPANLLEAVQNLPEHTDLPPLNQTWCLIRFVAAQPRLERVVATLVHPLLQEPDVQANLRDGEFLEGRIPGQSDWHFSFDRFKVELRWELRNRTTGEEILDTLPLLPAKGDAAGPAVVAPAPSLARQLHSASYGWGGYRFDEDRAISRWLAERLPPHKAALQNFYRRWQDVGQRAWLAARVDDWPGAHAAALLSGDERLITETERRARDWLSQDPRRVGELFNMGSHWGPRWAVRVLAQHQVTYLDDALKHAFRQTGGFGNVPNGLDIILHSNIAGWEEEVLCWFGTPHPELNTLFDVWAAIYLARRDVRKSQVIRELLRRTCSVADRWHLLAALAAAHFEPALGEGAFRAGLAAKSEKTCLEAMGGLTVAPWPWADGLLQEALGDLENPILVAACRLALEQREGSGEPTGNWEARWPAQQLLEVNRGDQFKPMRYLGTVEELLEDAQDEARQWMAFVNGGRGDVPPEGKKPEEVS